MAFIELTLHILHIFHFNKTSCLYIQILVATLKLQVQNHLFCLHTERVPYLLCQFICLSCNTLWSHQPQACQRARLPAQRIGTNAHVSYLYQQRTVLLAAILETEVTHLGELEDEDVAGLEVAMHNSHIKMEVFEST